MHGRAIRITMSVIFRGGDMIELLIHQRRRDLGGFEVGRVLPYQGGRMVGPFIFFDHMGPVDFPPGIPRSTDVRPHPHIGLSTITYLLEGEIMHRDSVGSEQPIRPGEVNWMTAGRGITHSERFERARREGGTMNGIQAWIALPDEHEETEPSFAHYDGEQLPIIEETGVRLRLIAGEAYGAKAGASVYSPLFYVHAHLQTGASVTLPREYSERAAYVITGAVEIGNECIPAGQMAVFVAGADLRIKAMEAADIMLLGGEPIGPRFIEWNFVSSSKQRIEQAKADWRAGRMKLPDLDRGEFIPLPDESMPPANPMS
jgi:redox-sensitive bicupin YhaK (pirin superfamily)